MDNLKLLKSCCVILCILLLLCSEVYAQQLISKKDGAFQIGEELKYKLRYGFLTAAEANLKVESTDVKFEGEEVFHLIAEGKTSGAFNVLYRVRNRYDSYISKIRLSPFLYTENIHESSYRRTDKARFYQDQHKVVSKKGTFKGDGQTFDLVSAYYFARNLDLTKVKYGDKFVMDYFLDDGVTKLDIQYVGKEKVETALGSFNCLKFSPTIQPGRIFRKDSKLFLWITDDGNRIPVKAQVELLVGSVTMELADASGLKYPLNPVDE